MHTEAASRRQASLHVLALLPFRALPFWFGLFWFGLGAPAFAEEIRPAAVRIIQAEPGSQELRTLLSAGHEIDPRQIESRRLNPQERQALRRELREAMRSAYSEQNTGKSQSGLPIQRR